MGKKRNFLPKQNTHDLLVGTLSIGIPRLFERAGWLGSWDLGFFNRDLSKRAEDFVEAMISASLLCFSNLAPELVPRISGFFSSQKPG